MKIRLNEKAKSYVSWTIWENRDSLYLIEELGERAFISTAPDPCGHICTFVNMEDVIR